VEFEETISAWIRAIETVGALIMVVGGGVAFMAELPQLWRPATRPGSYQRLRRNLGRAILLGLEVLIVADIIRTILVEPTAESVLVLGAIVLIRIALSFSLEVEIDGAWPWARAPVRSGDG
jgi:uncharacterized membrane protein